MSMTTVLRSPVPSDASLAGQICYDAFKTIAEQHGFTPDFPAPDVATGLPAHLISRPDVHGVIAESNGRVAGSNFLWEGDFVAGVGPITVDPTVQNNAIGRKLMEAVLDRARKKSISAVRLVQAAYHSRSLSLYTKLGFVSREPLVAIQGPPPGIVIARHPVRTARESDLPAMNALCERVHGHHRSSEASGAVRQGTAMVVEHVGRIIGYTTGVGFFGHSVGETDNALKALIAAAPAFGGPGFLLPIRQTGLFCWCLEQKLKVVMPMTLMSIGPYTDPEGYFLPSILY
jgi:GNAT superfamily N-acetyltransferase